MVEGVSSQYSLDSLDKSDEFDMFSSEELLEDDSPSISSR
jgi:hypothetical protein